MKAGWSFSFSVIVRKRSHCSEAADELEHLRFIRGAVVRQIEQRRGPLTADRNLGSELLDVLEDTYIREQKMRERVGEGMPEPKYERYQISSLEALIQPPPL